MTGIDDQFFHCQADSDTIWAMPRPVFARIHLEHLRQNYLRLQSRAGNAEVMAIVKANAYGHGIDLVAPALFAAGCRSFGVTDASEGGQLRALLPPEDTSEITLLSGIHDRDDARLCAADRLTPAITEQNQIRLLKQADFTGSVWIKIDTGMNRLGAIDAETLITACDRAGIAVRGIMSHLACADLPDHPLSREQAQQFRNICDRIAPSLPRSLLNSAGIAIMADQACDVVRPGIALYGAEPVADYPLCVKPVMTLTAEAMQIREVTAGTHISYGATFTAPEPMRIAVMSIGYADGIPRALSNRGQVWFNGSRLNIVGRVCMDYTMIDVTDIDMQPGDSVECWGNNIAINNVAESINTISYTLMTGVGNRVRRIAEYSG